MASLQQSREFLRMDIASVGKPFVKRFQLMSQVANRANGSHAGTTLEGMKIPQQG